MKRDLSQTCYLFFSTLANPTRLAILEHLQKGPSSVMDLAKILGQEQSMISHNLKTLARCRFVYSKRRKRENVYSLNQDTMDPLFQLVTHHAQNYCPTAGHCLPTPRSNSEPKDIPSHEKQ